MTVANAVSVADIVDRMVTGAAVAVAENVFPDNERHEQALEMRDAGYSAKYEGIETSRCNALLTSFLLARTITEVVTDVTV